MPVAETGPERSCSEPTAWMGTQSQFPSSSRAALSLEPPSSYNPLGLDAWDAAYIPNSVVSSNAPLGLNSAEVCKLLSVRWG